MKTLYWTSGIDRYMRGDGCSGGNANWRKRHVYSDMRREGGGIRVCTIGIASKTGERRGG